jgi:glucose/arabinose dehydrogenase
MFQKSFKISLLQVCLFFLMSEKINAQLVISLSPVITGLSAPIDFVVANDGTNRIFIPQQGGVIRVYDASYNSLGNFLTVAGISTGGERGLLSMAFSPNYSINGFFYVYYTNASGDLELARYHVSANPNVADASTKTVVLTIPHPGQANHNGGKLNFGTDGNLYMSTGDGGGAGDVPNNAQTTTVLLGKLLRIAVNNNTAPPYYTIPIGNPFVNEVWALGLRNPFRWSFDKQTNDIWIGDVGQDNWEEIDFTAAGTGGGVNYGWRCYEGNNVYNSSGCGPSSNYTFPVYVYPTQNPSAAVTGGRVYRGSSYTGMVGYYISCDFYSGNFYLLNSNGAGGFNTTVQTSVQTGISSFGERENGELFAVGLTSGIVYSVAGTIITAVGNMNADDGVKIYPAYITDGNLRILITRPWLQLDLISMNGNIVRSRSLNHTTGNILIGVSDLSKGVYLVRLNNGKKTVTQKIIIQ